MQFEGIFMELGRECVKPPTMRMVQERLLYKDQPGKG
jgi:hypothetical protein